MTRRRREESRPKSQAGTITITINVRRRCPHTGQELPTDDEIRNTDWVTPPTRAQFKETGDHRPRPIDRDLVRQYVFRRARGSWVDLADGDKKPRNLPKDSPVEGVFRARKQASPRAWGGYDEFANTVELMILVLATVMGAAFFGVGFYVIGVDNVLFKAVFAFYCLMIPLRLLADVLNRVTATKELRILGPINT
jgi:hypothetical protein